MRVVFAEFARGIFPLPCFSGGMHVVRCCGYVVLYLLEGDVTRANCRHGL